MPRGVEFTDQQRSVLSQLMRNAWARHKGGKPKMTKRWVNPWPKGAGKGYANPGAAWHEKKAIEARTDMFLAKDIDDKNKYFGRALAHMDSITASNRLHMANPRPRRTSNPKPKLGKLLLPMAIIGAIIWFTRKS